MRIKVTVKRKSSINDPEAEVILRSLQELGYDRISGLSQARVFYLETEESDKELALQIAHYASKVLHNSILEDCEVSEVE